MLADWCDIHFIEFYTISELNVKELIGVAVTDVVKSGLSAVYTFFDPEQGSQRGLGNFAILWQINYALEQDMVYLYPGFWIKECRKMNYKIRFQPIEGLHKGKWINLEKDF